MNIRVNTASNEALERRFSACQSRLCQPLCHAMRRDICSSLHVPRRCPVGAGTIPRRCPVILAGNSSQTAHTCRQVCGVKYRQSTGNRNKVEPINIRINKLRSAHCSIEGLPKGRMCEVKSNSEMIVHNNLYNELISAMCYEDDSFVYTYKL